MITVNVNDNLTDISGAREVVYTVLSIETSLGGLLYNCKKRSYDSFSDDFVEENDAIDQSKLNALAQKGHLFINGEKA